MPTDWYCDECGRTLYHYEMEYRSDGWPICSKHMLPLECPDPDEVDCEESEDDDEE